LAEKVLGLKISQKKNYNIIPIPIFSLFKYQKLNLVLMDYSEVYIDIDCEENIDYKFEGLYEFFEVKYIKSTNIYNINLILESLVLKYKIRDCVENYDLNLFGNNLGIIIWYIMGDNNLQFLKPEILKADISFYRSGVKYTKNIQNMEKIEVNNMIGYFIPTNNFNYNQMINFYKTVSCKTDFGIFDNFINWCQYGKSSIEINWSNFLVGSEIIIEKMGLNFLNTHGGISVLRITV
jgi:hypothetical protein